MNLLVKRSHCADSDRAPVIARMLPPVLSVIAGSADVTSFLGLGLFSAHVTGNLVILTYKDQVFHLMLFSRESFVANVIATLLWVDEVDKIPVESP